MTDLVEVIARAIYVKYFRPNADADWMLPIDEIDKHACRDEARTVISALDAAGYVVVPKEPTPEMQNKVFAMWGGGHTFAEIYRAMIEAKP